MAFFYDIVYDTKTRRHKLEFVNQQYDTLMEICFQEETGTYQLDVSLEFAQKVYEQWNGGVFELDKWLTLANKELTEADMKWPTGKPS